MEQPSGLPVRTSAIPRPSSRLPILKSSSSQSYLRSTSSSEQLRKKSSHSSLLRPAQPTPPLQKKASRTSLARSSISSAAASTSSSRSSLTPSIKPRVSSLTQSRAAAAPTPSFKKPTGRPPSRQTKPASQHVRAKDSNHETDGLGDLDAFRSASRASSRAGSRLGYREHGLDEVLNAESESTRSTPKKGRLSLSERTVESLASLPSSPAVSKTRRRSSFFNADGQRPPMPPPPRPGSALSNSSRPGTSDGPSRAVHITPRRTMPATQPASGMAQSRRSASSTILPSSSATPNRNSLMARPQTISKKPPLAQVQNEQTGPIRPLSSSKSMTLRTPKPRPSLAGAFGNSASPSVAASSPPQGQRGLKTIPKLGSSRKASTASTGASTRNASIAKNGRRSDVTQEPEKAQQKAKSSLILREQIAMAKKAARQSNVGLESRSSTPPEAAIVPHPAEIAEFDFGLGDPFNQGTKGNKSVLQKRIDGARRSGRLNIAAMNLHEMPSEVLNMYIYNAEDLNCTSIAWGELVDLTSIVAADNEFQTLPENMFPDIDYNALADSDEVGPQFGGVQNLDFHGNLLREVPMGLRRLPQLSHLNLSRNNISFDALGVIAQITTLRELNLAENDLQGNLPAKIASLINLEVLELQSNRLSSLPPEIGAMVQLRSLNVCDNQLKRFPKELFTSTPIVEVFARKNAFESTLFDLDCIPRLQNLQLSNNSITEFCALQTIDLPALQFLDLSANRLSSLPNVTTWTQLTTILVSENKLSSLPEGFVELQQLRIADFSGNDLNKLDTRIALMQGLENLTLAANPLRERKYLTMNTQDLKEDLRSRLESQEETESFGGPDELDEGVPTQKVGWTLTPSGTLDLSSQNLENLDEEQVTFFCESNNVRQLYLQQNSLITMPTVKALLSSLTVLDLSRNTVTECLTSSVAFPKLRELRLQHNKITSLTPLTTYLFAPTLQHLDISVNRIAGTLPSLRVTFPSLVLLTASDNSIDDVPAPSLAGLKIVNLSNNNIPRLDPAIGLHAGTLTSLDVEGNTFRVPNYTVLKKGTDALLNWLSARVPTRRQEQEDGKSHVEEGDRDLARRETEEESTEDEFFEAGSKRSSGW